jgi:type II secretory pathway pseudopilin PulG
MISGLVKSNYFQTEAWSISVPYTILIIGGFVVALLVFSAPFFKLVLAGPKDRFRARDVYLLVFSTLVILGVVTSFVLYGYVYWSVERQMDAQVEGLAENIKTNLDEELDRALRQLDRLSQNRELIESVEAKSDPTKKTDILPELLRSKAPYPYFDTAIWMNEAGQQKAKWTIKPYTSQYISASGRAYFDNIRRKHFYEFKGH